MKFINLSPGHTGEGSPIDFPLPPRRQAWMGGIPYYGLLLLMAGCRGVPCQISGCCKRGKSHPFWTAASPHDWAISPINLGIPGCCKHEKYHISPSRSTCGPPPLLPPIKYPSEGFLFMGIHSLVDTRGVLPPKFGICIYVSVDVGYFIR